MHRHSFSAPSIPVHLPATAPNTPVTSRTTKHPNSNRYIVPVTPQRILVQTKSQSLPQNQSQPAYQHRRVLSSHSKSPATPLSTSSSPYTPQSSSYSFSSNVTTPASAYSTGSKRFAEGVDVEKSLADIAENWRSRANENGIRVASSEGDADDEASERTHSSKGKPPTQPQSRPETQSDNPLGPGYVPEASLLPPPFLSTHRRPRAQGLAHSQSFSSTFSSPFRLSNNENHHGANSSKYGNKTKAHTKTKTLPFFFTPQPKSSAYPYGEQPSELETEHAEEDGESFDYGDSFEMEDQGYVADNSALSTLASPPLSSLQMQVPRTPLRLRPPLATAPQTLRSSNTNANLSPNASLNTNTNQNLYTPPQKPRHAEKLRGRGSVSEPPPRARSKVKSSSKPSFQFGVGRLLGDIEEDTGVDFFEDSMVGRGGGEGRMFEPYPYLGVSEEFEIGRPAFELGQGFVGGYGGGYEALNDPFFPAPTPGTLTTIREREGEMWEGVGIPPLPLKPTLRPTSLPPIVLTPQATPAPTTTHSSTSTNTPTNTPASASTSTTCSVCFRTGTQAILVPCSHPLCSACLTSALNIVGEKDMECCVCKRGVEDFRLVGKGAATEKDMEGGEKEEGEGEKADGVGTGKEVEGEEDETNGLLQSSFEFFDDVRAKSSPPPHFKLGPGGGGELAEDVVLRIDNVPWDITPPQIRTFFSNPESLTNVHVLLNGQGKTLSHAFVEFNDEEAARTALRGAQKNAVLGKGRRTRGVTVTMSGQAELMRSLFPSWKGTFDGQRPSLAGNSFPNSNPNPTNPNIISTLETGLLTQTELSSLLHFIRAPDSHFLKVPSLPFYSLVSLLKKFPVDCDSRVFWGREVRDGLFEVLVVGIQVLMARVERKRADGEEAEEEDMELVRMVFEAGMHCQAFTSQQIAKLTSLVDNTPHSFGTSTFSSSDSPPSSPISHLRTPETHRFPHPQQFQPQYPAHVQPQVRIRYPNDSGYAEPFDALAREFGVEAQLVQALAQRLAAF